MLERHGTSFTSKKRIYGSRGDRRLTIRKLSILTSCVVKWENDTFAQILGQNRLLDAYV